MDHTLLAISSLPWVLNNTTRPLIGPSRVFLTERERQLPAPRPELWEACREAAEHVVQTQSSAVDVVFGGDAAEYALRMLIHDKAPAEKLRPTLVAIMSARLTNSASFPGYADSAGDKPGSATDSMAGQVIWSSGRWK
jgi:hypothetical protein